MTANAKAGDGTRRRLRLGMVGGGPGAFIGAVHRIAARMDDRFELVAGALSSNTERGRGAALEVDIAPERGYGRFSEMVAAEEQGQDRIDAVSNVTLYQLVLGLAGAFLEA